MKKLIKSNRFDRFQWKNGISISNTETIIINVIIKPMCITVLYIIFISFKMDFLIVWFSF